jgi:hypothetical protein
MAGSWNELAPTFMASNTEVSAFAVDSKHCRTIDDDERYCGLTLIPLVIGSLHEGLHQLVRQLESTSRRTA